MSSLSAVEIAEKKREERRKKILNNRESRFKKILGDSPTYDKQIENLLKDIDSKDDNNFSTSENVPILNNEENLLNSTTTNKDVLTSVVNNVRISNTTTRKYIPLSVHRIILMLLGFILPFYVGQYFLIYFTLWEITFFILSPISSSDNIPGPVGLILNFATMMLQINEWITRIIKLFVLFWSQVFADLSVFIVSSLLTTIFF